MNSTQCYDRSILLSIFDRKGDVGHHTMPFESLDPKLADHVRKTMNFEPGELPILIVYFTEATWTLITNMRLAYCNKGQIAYIRLSDIESVEPKQFGKISKNRMDSLDIKTSNRISDCVIEVETGAPFSGIWNILSFISKKNHSLKVRNHSKVAS
jgi:hypothetical protein